jgi:hypothetical protein
MNGFFKTVEILEEARKANGTRDYFAIEYFSNQAPTNRFYVVMRDEQDFTNLKQSFKDWDFTFNRLAI